jgi:hypothetical protein
VHVREATKRWLVPVGLVATLAALAVSGIVLGSDSPLMAILVIPAVAVVVNAFVKALARRPNLSLGAVVGANSTSQRGVGTRVVSSAVVTLFLRNGEGSGEAKHVKVELSTTAAPDFRLDPGTPNATRNLISAPERSASFS